MLTKDNLNETLADAVMDRPREFYVDSRRFCLWSPTLGVSMMVGRHIEELGINYRALSSDPSLEALRLATENRERACLILSILSFRRLSELSRSQLIANRAEFFRRSLSIEETAQLLLVALNDPKPETLFELTGIKDDQKDLSHISEFKNRDGHNVSFGGKTIYGMLIDAACKAYGWTKQYVVWGIDLISLRMMLADSVNSVYLSDEEIKSLGMIPKSAERIGMGAEDFARLREMDWT